MAGCPLNIRPRIPYQVAKAAWEGRLLDRREEISALVLREFADQTTRRFVANQIRASAFAGQLGPADQPDDDSPQSSRSGRIYGRTGGVSEAVAAIREKLIPRRAQKFVPLQADGLC